MAPRLGFLMTCLSAAGSLASMQQRVGLVLLQQRVQKLDPEQQLNTSFAHALLESQHESAEEQAEFKAIEEKLFVLETSLSQERKRKVPQYAQALKAAKRATRGVQLRNKEIEAEIEEVNQDNGQMREKALTLKQETVELADGVGMLRAKFLGSFDSAAVALEGIEKKLEATTFQNIDEAPAPYASKVSLLGLSASTATSQPQQRANSILAHLEEVVQRSKDQSAALEAAFNKEMAATAAERKEYLKTQVQLNKQLANATATRDGLSAAISHLEATKQQLMSLRSLFQQHMPEFAKEPALATKASATETSTEDSAYWANMAFQIKGSQDDYSAVMQADVVDREATYDLIKNGPSFWADQAFQQSGNQEEYARIMAEPPLKRKIAYDASYGAAARGEPPSSATKVEVKQDPNEGKLQDSGLAQSDMSETHWAEQAYQVNGKQEDYELVMSVPRERRKEMFSQIKSGPSSDVKVETKQGPDDFKIEDRGLAEGDVSETHWAEQAFQVNGKQEDFDLVMSVPREERKEMFSRIKSGPSSDVKVETKQSPNDVKIEDRSIAESDVSETHWAEQAYQVNGKQEDYELVMSVPREERKEMFSRIKSGPSSGVKVETKEGPNDVKVEDRGLDESDVSETHWAEQAYQLNGKQEDYELVMSVPREERKEMFSRMKSGSETNSSDHAYQVNGQGNDHEVLMSVPREERNEMHAGMDSGPCQASQSTTDNGNEKGWMNEELFRQKYTLDHIDILLESGFVTSREHPGCPGRTEYLVNDEDGVHWLNEPDESEQQ